MEKSKTLLEVSPAHHWDVCTGWGILTSRLHLFTMWYQCPQERTFTEQFAWQ